MSVFAIAIEIGGTKLQVGMGSIDGQLLADGVLRKQVSVRDGAEGIRAGLILMVSELLKRKGLRYTQIARIGIGFGGILDSKQGVTLKSFQVNGWENFPLRAWAEQQWHKPVFVQNDAKVAGLAEALHGSGRGAERVFYMTIGSGIGGGWIVNERVDDGQGFGAAEVGHMWVPNPEGGLIELEQLCSGWGIGARARMLAVGRRTLLKQLAGSVDAIDAKVVYRAAKQGDALALRILDETCAGLGVALSHVVALLHPERIVVGGGVSLMGNLFWNRLRREVRVRSLPAFVSRVKVVRARFREEVVLVGALCLGNDSPGWELSYPVARIG